MIDDPNTPPGEPLRPSSDVNHQRQPGTRLLQVAAGTQPEAFRPSDWGLITAIAATWGASFLFIAIGLEAFNPYFVGFGRIALGALTLACIPSARQRIAREDWPRVAFLGLIWMALPLTLFPLAEQWVSSSLAGMLNRGMPILTAIVATALGLRRPGPIQIVGLVIGFVGVVLISLPSLQTGGNDALGVGLIACALICYALSANLAVPLQQRYGGPTLMLHVEAVGALLTAPLGLWGLRSSTFKWSSLAALAVLGIVGTGAAFALMAKVLGRVGATRGSMVTYLMPPVSILLGVLVRNETISSLSLVGIVVVLVGAWLVSRTDSNHTPKPAPAVAAR